MNNQQLIISALDVISNMTEMTPLFVETRNRFLDIALRHAGQLNANEITLDNLTTIRSKIEVLPDCVDIQLKTNLLTTVNALIKKKNKGPRLTALLEEIEINNNANKYNEIIQSIHTFSAEYGDINPEESDDIRSNQFLLNYWLGIALYHLGPESWVAALELLRLFKSQTDDERLIANVNDLITQIKDCHHPKIMNYEIKRVSELQFDSNTPVAILKKLSNEYNFLLSYLINSDSILVSHYSLAMNHQEIAVKNAELVFLLCQKDPENTQGALKNCLFHLHLSVREDPNHVKAYELLIQGLQLSFQYLDKSLAWDKILLEKQIDAWQKKLEDVAQRNSFNNASSCAMEIQDSIQNIAHDTMLVNSSEQNLRAREEEFKDSRADLADYDEIEVNFGDKAFLGFKPDTLIYRPKRRLNGAKAFDYADLFLKEVPEDKSEPVISINEGAKVNILMWLVFSKNKDDLNEFLAMDEQALKAMRHLETRKNKNIFNIIFKHPNLSAELKDQIYSKLVSSNENVGVISNKLLCHQYHEGHTLLHIAIQQNLTKTTDALLDRIFLWKEAGVKYDYKKRADWVQCQEFLAMFLKTMMNKEGDDPILYAIKLGRFDVVKAIFERIKILLNDKHKKTYSFTHLYLTQAKKKETEQALKQLSPNQLLEFESLAKKYEESLGCHNLVRQNTRLNTNTTRLTKRNENITESKSGVSSTISSVSTLFNTRSRGATPNIISIPKATRRGL